jgi:Peptidase family S41
MRKLVASLKDGHGNVAYSGATYYKVPLIWAWTENQLIVARVKDGQQQGVQPGDRVLSIDGARAETYLAEMESSEPGTTPQWIRWRALQDIATCDNQKRSMQLQIEPYSAPGTTKSVQFSCRLNDFDWSEPRPDRIATLEQGVMYADVGRFSAADWAAALPQLQAAERIVFDFRGYPTYYPPGWAQNLTQQTMRSEMFFAPTPKLPDQTNLTYSQGSYTLPPLSPYLEAKRVFLIDTRAISQAETDMDFIESNQLATFVGEPTAGTTGDVNPFALPGGITVTWTDLRVLKPDGSRFWGVGIQPNVPATRTRRGIAEQRDEVLERGLQVVKGL